MCSRQVPTAADKDGTTYSIPEVLVPARLLAIVGKALDVVKTVAGHAKHL